MKRCRALLANTTWISANKHTPIKQPERCNQKCVERSDVCWLHLAIVKDKTHPIVMVNESDQTH